MKFRASKKIMRPYVTLLNIFSEIALKAMDDVTVIMTPFWDIVAIILMVNVAKGNDKNKFFGPPSPMALELIIGNWPTHLGSI